MTPGTTPQIIRGACIVLVFSVGLLAACGEDETPDDKLDAIRAPGAARIVPASEALAGAHIPELDPATMNDAEVRKALGGGPHCAFRYTSDGKPVLAVKRATNGAGSEGIVKLNGELVALTGAAVDGRLALHAEDIRMMLAPDGQLDAAVGTEASKQEADLVFEVGKELSVGYRGYYVCHRDAQSSAKAPPPSE